MSRNTAIWSAATLALLFSLLVGAVVLRPSLGGGEAASAAETAPMVVVRPNAQTTGASAGTGTSMGAEQDPAAWATGTEDQGAAWDDEDEHDEEYEHGNGHEDDEHDDDD